MWGGDSIRRYVLLVWGLSFILAEVVGIGSASLLYLQGIRGASSTCLVDIIIISLRFLTLYCIASVCGVSIARAINRPSLTPRGLPILSLSLVSVILIDYSITILAYGHYKPQLLDINYFLEQGALWAFPFKILYYFSEIAVMNYMYILAKMAWPNLKPPITSGTIFLLLGWALPHVAAKNVIVALYAMALVLIFYSCYEYSGSPISTIILWFTVLIV